MPEQIINGTLTTLSSAITTNAQTTGWQVAAKPLATITGTVRAALPGGEIISFTGITGSSAPFTLTGVIRAVEATTATTYASGSQIALGDLTSAALAAVYATNVSPTFSGTVNSVTPTSGDQSTSVSTTAFVPNSAVIDNVPAQITGTHPSQIPGMVDFWLADDFAGLAEGASTGNWIGKISGTVLTRVVGGSNSQGPVKVTGFNGRPSVLMPGNVGGPSTTYKLNPGSGFTFPAGFTLSATSFSVYILCRMGYYIFDSFTGMVFDLGTGLQCALWQEIPSSTYISLAIYNGGIRTTTNAQVISRDDYQFVGVSSSTSNLSFKVHDAQPDPIAALGAASLVGGRIGGAANSTSFDWGGEIQAIFIANQSLTQQQIDQLFTFTQSKNTKALVVVDGDSLSMGYNATNENAITNSSPISAAWPTQLAKLFNHEIRVINFAYSGQQLAQMNATRISNPQYGLPTTTANLVDPFVDNTERVGENILVVWAGTNDVYTGSGGGSVSAATAHASLQTYCLARRTAGWKVIVITCIPRTTGSQTLFAGLTALIQANWSAYSDGIFDPTLMPEFASAATPVYDGSDFTHLSPYGYYLIAKGVQGEVNRLIAKSYYPVGTRTNDTPTPGIIGEFATSSIAAGSPISLSNNSPANVTSIVIQPGDYDAQGNVNFSAASATVTGASAGLSTSSATIPTDGTECYSGVVGAIITEINTVTVPRKRFTVAAGSTSTVYLTAKSSFSAGSVGVFGTLTINRRR